MGVPSYFHVPLMLPDVWRIMGVPSYFHGCPLILPYFCVLLRQRAGDAVHVLDRYHVMSMMNKAIDKVRASEARQMEQTATNRCSRSLDGVC